MSEELKPCPFCGGEPYFIKDNSYGDAMVGCNCSAEPCFATAADEKALEALTIAWNTRTT